MGSWNNSLGWRFDGQRWGAYLCSGMGQEVTVLVWSQVLIILDDVWSAKVVEAFMVGCPLLVTTKDSSVVDELKMNIEWVQVEEGFTLQETKDLFTQVHEAQNGPLVEGIHEAYRGKCFPIFLRAEMVLPETASNYV